MQKLVQTVKRWLIFYVFLNLIFSHKALRLIPIPIKFGFNSTIFSSLFGSLELTPASLPLALKPSTFFITAV